MEENFSSTAWPVEVDKVNGTLSPGNAVPILSSSFLVMIGLSAITVLGNAVILLAFANQKKLWTYNNYYIFNMTLADLFVGAVVMPLRATITLYGRWILGRVFGIIFLTLQNGSLAVSVMGVVVITIDRYIATMHPVTHYSRKSKRIATIVNVFTWIIPFALWIGLCIVWDFVDPLESVTSAGLPSPHYAETVALSLLMFCLRFAWPFLMILVLYLRVYFQIRTRLRKRPSANYSADKSDTDTRNSIISNGPSASFYEESEMANTATTGKENMQKPIGEPDTLTVSTVSLQVSERTHKELQQKGQTDDDDVKGRQGRNTTPFSRNGAVKRGISNSTDFAASSKDAARKKQRKESSGESLKAMTTLSFIIIAFAITWIPITFNIVFSSVARDVYKRVFAKVHFQEIARWITYSNSMVNPAAYALAQPLIRQTISRMFCRRCR
ncbi:muscarinic acetylcholine receptor M1-like [Diadema antillarum]|uniref:muscarinic acetylcholine receptor M1-like n=1 Tax=Diadema antillarum TaxID=105358 RepID=UPI003A838A62